MALLPPLATPMTRWAAAAESKMWPESLIEK